MDDAGNRHIVNTTCTHMGCELNGIRGRILGLSLSWI